jgi:hypothetical protein
VRHETEEAEARMWSGLNDRQPVAHGEQQCIHPRAGVSGHGAGPGEVSWAARPRWAGAGLIQKKKRREEEIESGLAGE